MRPSTVVLVPSVVAFAQSGERLVGTVAKRQAVTNPTNTVFSIKRFMGRKEAEVREEESMVPYQVVSGAGGDARVVALRVLVDLADRAAREDVVELVQQHGLPERAQLLRRILRAAEPVRERRLGAIVLSRGHDPSAAQGAVTALLVDHFRREGLAALPLSPACRTLLARARYAGIEALSEPALKADAEGWLGDIAGALNSLRKLDPTAIRQALHNRLTYQQRMDLERYAPAEFTSPAGTSHAIDYAGDDAPSVEVRVQALFGLEVHPMIGTTPLLLKLTSPAGRPLQSTRDLPGFWRGSWAEVKKEMKGRYPKHRWPDEPWTEKPSLKTKNAFARDES